MSLTPAPRRETGSYVFISYSHNDIDFAELLQMKLENVGIKAWIDREELRAGEDWRVEIDEAIRNACALIAIMTPESRKSEYVAYEWAFALGAGTRVIPIMRKSTKLHPKLEVLQYLNFTNQRPWDELIAILRSIEYDLKAVYHSQSSGIA